MDEVRKKRIRKLSRYVKFIEDNCDAENVLYRGQPIIMPLLPKIARPQLRLTQPLLKAEKYFFEEFKSRSLPYLDKIPDNSWDWLSLAQHYGLPTRLLDWTLNPLAALWFAVKDAPKKSSTGIVWIFHVKDDDCVESKEEKKIDPFTGRRTKAFFPRDITKRIIAQQGVFTVHKYVGPRKGFIPLEKNILYRNSLLKIVISANAFSALRYELDKCAINSATMFPDLDGLCKNIEWCNSNYDDEDFKEK